MKINFNNREIDLKYRFESDIKFEAMMDKSFSPQGTTDWIAYFYCTYLTLTEDYELSLEDCEKLLSELPTLLFLFIKWYTDVMTNIMKFVNESKKEDKDDLKNV